jgi:putative NADH-flavin reductase
METERTMRLALLGGSGRIGAHVLRLALDSGHEVAVLARDPQSVPAAAGLTVIAGDAADAGAVTAAVDGTGAVLSALGPRGAKTPALLATAARNVVAAMQKSGTRRVICVSAAGAFIEGDPDTGALVKLILPRIFAGPFADVRAMEAVFSGTDLDWTMVRPTRLVNSPLTGNYRVAPQFPPAGGRKISRADVAHFMATVLEQGGWSQGRPALAY